jgi:hypothetical protein
MRSPWRVEAGFRGLAQAIERAALGERPVEVERLAETNVLGNGLVDQRVETQNAHDPQHFGDLLGRRPDVATIRKVVGFVCVGAHLVPAGIISFQIEINGLCGTVTAKRLQVRHY